MLGAASSTFGSLGFGFSGKKDKSKSKTSTPGSTTPAWGNAFGSGVATSTAESTGGGGGGWGSATGNNSGSNSTWPGMLTGKSVNASTADLGGDSSADHMFELDNIPAAELPEYQVPTLPETGGEGALQGFTEEGATQEETQGGGASAEETHTREHLTLVTDVAAEPGPATTAPNTAGESPEGGEGGGEGEGEGGGGDEGGEKPPDDDWGIPVKTKKKKGGGGKDAAAATPVTPSGGGAAPDDWANTTTKKKKGKGGRK